MRKFTGKLIVAFIIIMMCLGTVTMFAAENNNTNDNNIITEEGTAVTLRKMKDDQAKDLESLKAKYGSDGYGTAAYILNLVQKYSIPFGIVGIAVCGIYQYVIGLKRLDIRDKGFNTMIAIVTIVIICQILPLIFAVVVKSAD